MRFELFYKFAGVEVSNTPLTIACKIKSTQSVDSILRNLYDAKPDMVSWFISNDDHQSIYSLKAVYENVPGALEFLFTKSIKIDMENSNENRIVFWTDLRYEKKNKLFYNLIVFRNLLMKFYVF